MTSVAQQLDLILRGIVEVINPNELESKLARAIKDPFLYLKSALYGWWTFWRTSFYWSTDVLRFPWLVAGVNFVVQIQRFILFMINLIFIFSSMYFMLTEWFATIKHKRFRVNIRFVNPAKNVYFWLLLGTIWSASIMQTLLDHGDNPRFLVPLQSLVVLWVGLFFFQLFISKHNTYNAD